MRPSSRFKKIFFTVLLAIVCIGGTELLVCRFADPVLYARIVDPVRQQASIICTATTTAVSDVWDQAVTFISRTASSFQKDEADPLEDQAAAEPDAALAPPLTADPAITVLEQRDAGEVLTGGSIEVLYYNQADSVWCDLPYGQDNIGKYGCGPTSLAMAVSSLTDQIITPVQMAQWASTSGYWAKHSGSYLSIINGAAKKYNLTVESLPDCNANRLRLELSAGKIGVALMTKGHFTNGGHFILLRGATLDGSILVADPNSRERSLTTWDAQLILDELSKSRSNGAPLWLISTPNSQDTSN